MKDDFEKWDFLTKKSLVEEVNNYGSEKSYLFIMGGSGCGKTTLAKNLEKFFPDVFKRVVQITTREIRDDEVEGIDYKFKSIEEYEDMDLHNEFFETVKTQFHPNLYAAEKAEIDQNKWNILVVSIEGFLSALKNANISDTMVLLNIINDVELDIQRSKRNPEEEQNINYAILRNLVEDDVFVDGVKLEFNGKSCIYKEIRSIV